MERFTVGVRLSEMVDEDNLRTLLSSDVELRRLSDGNTGEADYELSGELEPLHETLKQCENAGLENPLEKSIVDEIPGDDVIEDTERRIIRLGWPFGGVDYASGDSISIRRETYLDEQLGRVPDTRYDLQMRLVDDGRYIEGPDGKRLSAKDIWKKGTIFNQKIRIVEGHPVSDHEVWLRFHDGTEVVHDFRPQMTGIHTPLKDPELFRNEFHILREGSAIGWPDPHDRFCGEYDLDFRAAYIWQLEDCHPQRFVRQSAIDAKDDAEF